MNYSLIKEYCSICFQVESMENTISFISEEIETLVKSQGPKSICGINYDSFRMNGNNHRSVRDILDEIEELVKRRNKCFSEFKVLIGKKKFIEKKIDGSSKALLQVAKMHFNGTRTSVIAKRINYSERHVQRLINKLNNLE